jgi:NAD+ kinase
MSRLPEKFEKIAFVASDVPEARAALERLAKAYGNAEPKTADAIVALLLACPRRSRSRRSRSQR